MSGGEIESVIAAGETAVVADAAAAEVRPGAQGRLGQPCANCGATLQGQHCHACGQLADDLHRPIWSLFADAVEGLFSLDGRFVRTVPTLLFRPGRVSATYLAGGRARYVQPFRLFLFSALAFLLAVSVVAGDWTRIDFDDPTRPQRLADAQRALEEQAQDARDSGDSSRAAFLEQAAEDLAADRTVAAVLERARDETAGEGPAVDDPTDRALRRAEQRRNAKCEVRRQLLPEELGDCPAEGADEERRSGDVGFNIEDDGDIAMQFDNAMLDWPIGVRRHLVRQTDTIIDDPSRFLEAINRWLPRVLIGLFPVYALLLALTHFWKRRFFVYDHLVVSLHFHAFLFLLLTLLIALSPIVSVWLLCAVFVIWSNIYLYKAHRLVYRAGRFTSVLRVLVLDFTYLIILSFVPVVLAIGGFLTA